MLEMPEMPEMNAPIQVLIADDHPVVRAGLQGLLRGRPEVVIVGEASDGEEAVRKCRELQPAVVLMDLRMPRLDGAAATARIRAECEKTRVLILTTYDGDEEIDRAIRAGATGYLLKDAPPDELLRAILATARGESLISPAITARLMRRAFGPAQAEPVVESLTAREHEVLRRVARGQSNKEVAAELSISETTVKTHLLHIFAKLGVDDRTAAVTVALRRGLLSL
jgi:DNA-binding NarL/FixJ family response regulator